MLCVHEISAADIFLIYCIVFYTACLPDEPDISISGKDEVICGNSVEFKANIDHSEFLFFVYNMAETERRKYKMY